MESYIVRIYRVDQTKPRAIVGVVEEAGKEGKKAFMNYDELWDILNPMHKEPLKKRQEQREMNLEG
jgi:hypothetical protein